MGGSGKRQLADGVYVCPKTIGKLRRLRLPLPPIALHLDRGASPRPSALTLPPGDMKSSVATGMACRSLQNPQDQSYCRLTLDSGPDMLAPEILEGIRTMLRTANLVSVGALLALLAGCTTVEERLELRKPTARLVAVRFQEATPHSATLVFDVEIENHYPLTVPLLGFKYSLSSGGQLFLSGSSEVRINLPADSRRTVALPAQIDYLEALKILGNVKPGATIAYVAELDLRADTPRLGPILLPLTRSGQLTLPTISEAIP